MFKLRTECHECGSDDLTWELSLTGPRGIPVNRLNTHDIVPVFYLVCNNCSATIQVINEGSFMNIVNQLLVGE